MGFWDYVDKERAVVTGAPLSFVILAALAAGGGFWVGAQWRNPELAAKDTYIGQLEKGRADDADIVKQAKEAWGTLTKEQISQLHQSLAATPTKTATINYWTGSGQQNNKLIDIFKDSGWSATYTPSYDTTFTPSSDTTVLAPKDRATFTWTKAALDAAAIPYIIKNGTSDVDSIWVAYGGSDSATTPSEVSAASKQ